MITEHLSYLELQSSVFVACPSPLRRKSFKTYDKLQEMRIDLVMRGVPILLMGIYIIQNTVYKVVKKVIKIN